MRNILLLLFISLSSLLNAQIVLTSTDFAGANDTIRMSQATDPQLDYTSTGANHTWDFSALVPDGQILRDYNSMSGAGALTQLMFGAVAPTKYKASYYLESNALPIAQLTQFLPVSIDNIYQYTRKSVDSLTSIGYSMSVDGFEIPFRSDTIEKKYDYPVEFGNSHLSRGYTNVDMSQVIDAKWRQYRVRFSNVDGYGSITTPYGTFNALRIKHDISEIDSLYYTFPFIGAMWIPLPIPDSHEYEWWTNGEKEPILRVVTNEVNGTEFITSIEYRDIYRAMANLSDNTLTFGMYPNPVANTMTISSGSDIETISIIDVSGKTVHYVSAINNTECTISMEFLAKGSYTIIVTSGTSIGRSEFVKL